MTVPSVFVVIPNWNRKELLRRCLSSIQENTSYPQCTVVVVDNGSVDGSSDMVEKEFGWVKLIKNRKNVGYSKANNQSICHAMKHGATHILLLNNDVQIVEKEWLDKLIAPFASDPKIGMVGCKLLYPNGRIQHAGGYVDVGGPGHRGCGEKDEGQYDAVQVVDFVTGAVLMVKVEILNRIGLLDEGFSPFYFEDTDWCARARFYGHKVVYTPHPKFIHLESSTLKSIRKEKVDFYWRRNWIRFFLLNFAPNDIRKRVFLYEPRELLDCIISVNRTGIFPRVRALFSFKIRNDGARNLVITARAWIANLQNLGDILIKRRKRFSDK